MTPAAFRSVIATPGPAWLSRLRLCLAANTPALLIGPPGVGKTDLIRASHEALFPGLPLVTVIVSQSDPTELNGLAVVMPDGAVSRVGWGWCHALVEAGGGTVFLDELSTASPASQAAAMRMVLERTVGEIELPDETRFVAAANPPDCAAGGWDLAPPLANRLAHIEVGRYATASECAALSSDLAPGWSDWALSRHVTTESDREAAALVAGFIASNPPALFDFPQEESQRSGAWSSPRSWATYLRALSTAIDCGVRDAGLDLCGAFVGAGNGTAFRAFAKTSGLPRAIDLLEGRAVYQFTRARADLARAVLASVATTAVHADVGGDEPRREAYIDTAWSLINSACDAGLKECVIPAAKTLRAWRRASRTPASTTAAESVAMRSLAKALSDVIAVTG